MADTEPKEVFNLFADLHYIRRQVFVPGRTDAGLQTALALTEAKLVGLIEFILTHDIDEDLEEMLLDDDGEDNPRNATERMREAIAESKRRHARQAT